MQEGCAHTIVYNVNIVDVQLALKGYEMPVVSARITDDQAKQLDMLSIATDRKVSFLVSEAIDDLIEENLWQVAEIKQAIAEADAGMFASDEQMEKFRQKWLGS